MTLLSGCTALSSTTRDAGKAAAFVGTNILRATRATGRASVTAPDMPRLASATAFMRSQRPMLAREAAVGGGEDIDALALLLDKPDNQELGRWMQSHYAELFGRDGLDADRLIARIDAHEG